MRKMTHRVVFSSSWSRVEQALAIDEDEWQIDAPVTNCGQNMRNRNITLHQKGIVKYVSL